MYNFTLSYSGESSDQHQIDLYDVGQALIGFQRSLAITTHLILNDKVIVQSPSLKGAKILTSPAEEGSWRMTAMVVMVVGGVGVVLKAPKDSFTGHLIYSAYDYVIHSTLGVDLDYDKSFRQLYEESKKEDLPIPTQHKLDSAAEKCEKAVKEIHRPIIGSKTANKATLSFHKDVKTAEKTEIEFTQETFDNMSRIEGSEENILEGFVSSYNINTYKGRIFSIEEGRPIPFELVSTIKNPKVNAKITEKMYLQVINPLNDIALLKFRAYPVTNRAKRLISYKVAYIED